MANLHKKDWWEIETEALTACTRTLRYIYTTQLTKACHKGADLCVLLAFAAALCIACSW
jgi:hypothetical protein